ncbi:hypothetical protein FOCG_13767 [Fusarium oxysporum f. sp. radicis-lycopersici 26381]|uniref:Uncharacterized protein n=1 Tax=Fusarium oxysporum Fo47 TaxID=660027 RepID=W9K6V4_FUSOX|nr:hypothetical protein FOZG_08949 [Fusarium oxysporum Fo47]EXL44952.1 hypothetical protein FOCG_13767 [Fusarium oxysporum f. sp. radicis-lycopersici 26381]
MKVCQVLPLFMVMDPSTYPFGLASTYNWLGEIKVKVIPVRKAPSRLQLDRLPQLLISQIFLKVDGSY